MAVLPLGAVYGVWTGIGAEGAGCSLQKLMPESASLLNAYSLDLGYGEEDRSLFPERPCV